MPPAISASVGRNGVNRADDVSTIQQLINDHLPASLEPLDVDGNCGVSTPERNCIGGRRKNTSRAEVEVWLSRLWHPNSAFQFDW